MVAAAVTAATVTIVTVTVFRAEPLNGENAIDRDASYLDQRPGCEQGQLHSVRCGEGQLSTAGTDRELRGARVDDRALCFDLDDPVWETGVNPSSNTPSSSISISNSPIVPS